MFEENFIETSMQKTYRFPVTTSLATKKHQNINFYIIFYSILFIILHYYFYFILEFTRVTTSELDPDSNGLPPVT